MYDRALKVMRQYHRLSQTELANELGISNSYVNDIERDRKVPSLDILNRYAKRFDIPLSSLQLFAERADEGNLENVREFAADKVLRVLEWIAEDEAEKRSNRDSAHSY